MFIWCCVLPLLLGTFTFFETVKEENEDLTAAKVDCVAPGDNSKNVKYRSFLKP